LPGAGDRAAGADAGDQDVDRALGIVPDFLGGGLAVDLGVGGVLELLRNDRIRQRRGQFLGLGDRALHALRAFRQHQFGAEQRQHLAALDRHRLGHGEDQLVALGCGREGERDAGIA
jgi:hypothetical protein